MLTAHPCRSSIKSLFQSFLSITAFPFSLQGSVYSYIPRLSMYLIIKIILGFHILIVFSKNQAYD